jgi:hypothetical protein
MSFGSITRTKVRLVIDRALSACSKGASLSSRVTGLEVIVDSKTKFTPTTRPSVL